MSVSGGVDHEVVVVGGGPTGMVLAVELVLAGVDVVVVERRPDHQLDGSRAGGLHARTLELLDQRGVVERFTAEGRAHPFVGFAGTPLDLADAPSRHNYVLALWQRDIERILAGWADEVGVAFRHGREATAVEQDDLGVDVHLDDGSSLRAAYVVGCDGGRSVVRRAVGIEFAGWDPTISFLIAEADTDEPPELGPRPEGGGIGPVDPAAGEGPYRFVLAEEGTDALPEPTLGYLRQRLVAFFGTDFGVRDASWISRFTDATRQAVAYRHRRVLLAGDAAHVHAPHGGQGLNTGVQDAVNLGWKLARVVHGTAPDALLDTYHAERHPVGARVLQNTMAQVALSRTDERSQALRAAVLAQLAMDEPRRHVAAMVAGLDIHYDLGEGHPLLGRRMPDLDLDTDQRRTRVAELLRDARPLLLDLAPRGGTGRGAGVEDVPVVTATAPAGRWELPVLGPVQAPAAVLVRPDGYVAWTGELGDADLSVALRAWGNAAAAP